MYFLPLGWGPALFATLSAPGAPARPQNPNAQAPSVRYLRRFGPLRPQPWHQPRPQTPSAQSQFARYLRHVRPLGPQCGPRAPGPEAQSTRYLRDLAPLGPQPPTPRPHLRAICCALGPCSPNPGPNHALKSQAPSPNSRPTSLSAACGLKPVADHRPPIAKPYAEGVGGTGGAIK